MKRLSFYLAVVVCIWTLSLNGQELQVADNFGLNIPVNVYYTGASGISGSWIGIYRSGAEDGQYISYQYINEKTEGELSFGPGYEPGYYNFRLYSGGGYNKIATSKTFLIRQGLILDTDYAQDAFFKWDASGQKLANTAKAVRPVRFEKLVVAGEVNTGLNSPNGAGTVNFTVFRLNGDGSLDGSFGNHGKLTIEPYSSYFNLYLRSVKAMAIQPDNKIIIGGETQVYTSMAGLIGQHILLVRLLENGSIDESFGDKGFALHHMYYSQTENSSNIDDYLHCMEVNADGNILIGGGSIIAAPYSPGRPFIGKILPNGMIDVNFAGIGFVTPLDSIFFRGYVESILLPGETGEKSFYAVASAIAQFGKNHQMIYKFNDSGSFDTSFGENGLKVLRYEQANNNWYTKSILKHPLDGLTLIGQMHNSGIWLSNISRVTGEVSQEFGTSGFVTANPFEGSGNYVSKGNIYGDFINVVYTSALRRIGMSRFNWNGQLDRSFSHSYLEQRETASTFVEFSAFDFVQVSDDRFLIAGNARYYANPHWETIVVAFKNNPEIIISPVHEVDRSMSIQLHQNIPNPFRGVCVIPVTVRDHCTIALELFSMNGDKLGTIYEGIAEPGEHLFQLGQNILSNNGLQSGSYIYTLTVYSKDNSFTQSKKMILLD